MGMGRDGMGRARDGHLNIKISEKFHLPYHSYAKPILENTLLGSFRSIHEKWYFFYFGFFNRSETGRWDGMGRKGDRMGRDGMGTLILRYLKNSNCPIILMPNQY